MYHHFPGESNQFVVDFLTNYGDDRKCILALIIDYFLSYVGVYWDHIWQVVTISLC